MTFGCLGLVTLLPLRPTSFLYSNSSASIYQIPSPLSFLFTRHLPCCLDICCCDNSVLVFHTFCILCHTICQSISNLVASNISVTWCPSTILSPSTLPSVSCLGMMIGSNQGSEAQLLTDCLKKKITPVICFPIPQHLGGILLWVVRPCGCHAF